MTCPFCLNMLAEVCGEKVLLLASDCVANVRFNVAKSLQEMSPYLESSVIDTQAKRTLEKLNSGVDVDVKHFDSEAMAGIAADYI
ncbi:serine/threonine-protein phosphatase PP2A 65 kDa regulatory subunit-like isoform X1 [Glossina fuscipes]|uniref:Serine/threonine-protein phosphatase PP2A 65 kDa regulatory subunit-like isoform X1 n=1 Tax=Glossina fuscipes TaxID=7396 RepID=A0A9C6DZW0_9MUSC|nr:serine/threonine-protein phosphatase PP2A 65 kDa regulatory subunit-like isoform X1 [Glossina fuscipes]